MDYDDAVRLLPRYVSGMLTLEEKTLIEDELMRSEPLRGELAFWRDLQDAMIIQAEYDRGMHLQPAEIIDYYEGEFLNDPVNKRRIKEHLNACQDCRNDFAVAKSMYSVKERAENAFGQISETLWERLRELTPHIRLRYALPITAVAVIAMVMLISRPGDDSTVLFATLDYPTVSRGSKHLSPPRTLTSPGVPQRVDLTLLVPKLTVPSIRYSISLVTPSGKIRIISDSVGATLTGNLFDEIHISIRKELMMEGAGSYTLRVREVVPVHLGAIPPNEWDYRFELKLTDGIGN